jgi:shikimate dehydrogenase
MPVLSGTTRVLGIIGYPVRHSLSPAIQNAAIAECGIDYVYVPFSVEPESLGAAVSGLRALGVRGFNVTIPHKSAIIGYLDELDASASDAGAVNTVLVRDGRMIGYNTDGYGLINSLAEDLNYVPGTGNIMVIGAGGAARGAVAALCRVGAKGLVIVNRSFDKAFKLAEDFGFRYPETRIEVTRQDQLSENYLNSVSLVINASSIGMNGDRIEFVNLDKLPITAKVYDMVYSPFETLLVKNSRLNGLSAVNGLGMLAAQGEKAFSIWTGKIPPKGLMKQVLQRICCS